jgi:superfamily II DNA or RNA helicase
MAWLSQKSYLNMLRDLKIRHVYDSAECSLVDDLITPLLSNSLWYWRGVGYFSSSWLSVAAEGITALIENGGKARIICSPILSVQDWEAIQLGEQARSEIHLKEALSKNIEELADSLNHDLRNCLAWMISDELLEFRFAIIRQGWGDGDYHDKVGVFEDASAEKVAIHGSFNDSAHATLNGEAFSVFRSWDNGQNPFVEKHYSRLQELWRGENRQFSTFGTPDVVRDRLIRLKSTTEPPYRKDPKKFSLHELLRMDTQSHRKRDLWPHQKKAIEEWFKSGNRGIFEMATGSGKTFTALRAAEELNIRETHLAIVILVPFIHLVDQWKDECVEADYVVTSCGSAYPQWHIEMQSRITDFRSGALKNICIIAVHDTASSERFLKVLDRLIGQNVLLIADEMHELGSGSRRNALSEVYRFRLGLSATPARWFDEEGTAFLFQYFGGVCFQYTLSEAIGTALTPYIYTPIIVSLTQEEQNRYEDLTNRIVTIAGEKNEIRGDMNEQLKILLLKRVAIIAGAENKRSHLRELLLRKKQEDSEISKTLVYAAPGKHRLILDDIAAIGLRCHEFVHTVSPAQRTTLLEQFGKGDYQILVAVKCLDQGVDVPSTQTAYFLASTSNPREFVQRRGRVLRKADGKKRAELIDFFVFPSNNVTGVNQDTLKGLIRREMPRFAEFSADAVNLHQARAVVWNTLSRFGMLDMLEKKPWDIYREMKNQSEIRESELKGE